MNRLNRYDYLVSLMEESAGVANAISKIMCAVDGSEHSFRAANYAVAMAKNFGAELRLVHVIHNTGYTNPDDYGLYDLESEEEKKSEIQEIREETGEWLERIKNSAGQERSLLAKIELVGTSTSIESAIVNYAKKNIIEIIIIGATGKSGIKKLLVGGVTSAVINHAHCPVMVVK
jgi:nucleotide-binding universal stress UspA family protein